LHFLEKYGTIIVLYKTEYFYIIACILPLVKMQALNSHANYLVFGFCIATNELCIFRAWLRLRTFLLEVIG